MIKKINSCLLLILTYHFFQAQVDAEFIKHLTENKLKDEHRTYLSIIKGPQDSLHYFEANFNLTYFNDSLFIEHFLLSRNLFLKDSALLNRAGALFLLEGRKKFQEKWFQIIKEREQNNPELSSEVIYKAAFNPNYYKTIMFPDELKVQYDSYRKVYNKKPFVGAALSMIIPGMGKVYGGKTQSGIAAFLMCAGYAVQTYESKKRLGIRHPFTLINASAFVIFYFSNVYGGYHTVTGLKKERKKQFIYDATNYYN